MANSPGRYQPIPSHTTEYGLRLDQALRHAREVSDDYLLHNAADIIVESLTSEHAAATVVINFDEPWVDQEPPVVRGLPTGDPDVELTINFTAHGCTGALWNRGLPISMRALEGSPTKIRYPVPLNDKQLADLSAASLKQAIDSATTQLRKLQTTVNREIASHRERLRQEVSQVVEPRWKRVRAFRQAADVLGIPVTPRADADLIPLQPRKVTLRQFNEARSKGSPEWKLEGNWSGIWSAV